MAYVSNGNSTLIFLIIKDFTCMKFFAFFVCVFLPSCSDGNQPRMPKVNLNPVIFLDYGNMQAPERIAQIIRESLNKKSAEFKELGNLGPLDVKEWYFKNGGRSTPLTIGDTRFGLTEDALFDEKNHEVFTCQIGTQIQMAFVKELRKIDEAGSDTSIKENQISSFRLALAAVEKELQK